MHYSGDESSKEHSKGKQIGHERGRELKGALERM